jgi:hypothetical protein
MELGNPNTAWGFVHWMAVGAIAIGLVLLVGNYFPSIIPARVSSTKL